MKKLLFCILAILFAPVVVYAQGVLINLPPITNSQGQPIAGATIKVFNASGNAGALVCGASASIFNDAALSSPIATLLTDGFGNFPFYIATSGNPYGYTVTGQGTNSSICYGFMAQLAAGSSPAFSTLTVTGNATVGGTLTSPTINGITYVTTHTDAAVQAALAQCGTGGTGFGIVYLTDAALGAWPTLTTTMTVPAHCKLIIGNVVNAGAPNGLSSSANPVVNLNCGGTPDCGATLQGLSRGLSRLTATSAAADTVGVAASCNWCKIEDISLSGTGTARDTVRIQDNQRELVMRNITENPGTGGTCTNYIPGVSGFNFIELDQVTCAPQGTNSGIVFNLSSGSGTNLLMLDVFVNGSGTTAIGIDLSAVHATLGSISSQSSAIGVRTGNTPGSIHFMNPDIEINTTAGIQVNGTQPVIIDSALLASNQIGIQVQSTGSTFIRNPQSVGTVGANSIVYTAAATSHNWLFGEDALDKVILVNASANVSRFNSSFVSIITGGTTGLGIGDVPLGTLDVATSAGDTTLRMVRGGSPDWEFSDENGAGDNCAGSATGDACLRAITNGIVFGTGSTSWLRFASTGLGTFGKAIVSGGTAATLTGTGACATITTQTGGSFAGRATCTGTTGASTLTITPGTTAPNGWVCDVWDETTRANALQQTSTTATTCVLTATSITANDVFVFKAIAF